MSMEFDDDTGRRLLVALADQAPAFRRQAYQPTGGVFRRLIIGLADAAPAFTPCESDARSDAALDQGKWFRKAAYELKRALRTGASLAVGIIAVDHMQDMKDLVDADSVRQLNRDVTSLLLSLLPESAALGVLGDWEFAALFPGTGAEEARRVSERIRDVIAAEPIAIEVGNQVGYVFRLTVSIGVSVLGETRTDLNELLGRAYAALAQARSGGWSKVSIASERGGDAMLP